MVVFTIRDNVAETCSGLGLANNIDHMRRLVFESFSQNPKSSQMRYPEDYSVIVLGEYDERVGSLNSFLSRKVIPFKEIIRDLPQTSVSHDLSAHETK